MQIIAGIKKDLQSVASFSLNGETYTPVTLTALIQSRLDAANAAAVARAKWLEAAAAYQAVNTKGVAVVHDLKQLVMATFGRTATQLADFGFTPRKVAVLTTEQKAARLAKAKATRAARGTQGPKAKLTTTGETVRIAALEAAAKNAGSTPASPAAPVAAPTAAPAPVIPTAPVLAPTVAPANGAPPAVAPSKA